MHDIAATRDHMVIVEAPLFIRWVQGTGVIGGLGGGEAPLFIRWVQSDVGWAEEKHLAA